MLVGGDTGRGDRVSNSEKMRRQLRLSRPSLRREARAPRLHTAPGEAFSAANLPCSLVLRQCASCGGVQYPPQEVCSDCLGGELVWRPCAGDGMLLSAVDLQHSLWEFFRRRLEQGPWAVASVRLQVGVTVFAHLHAGSFAAACAADVPLHSAVSVFSHTDCSGRSVLIAVAADTPVQRREERHALAADLGLLEPAIRPEGI